jgi:SAM-dependent methyltransferase
LHLLVVADDDAHCFEGASALRLQGASLPPGPRGGPACVAAVSVQPDHIDSLRERGAAAATGAVTTIGALPSAFAFPGRRGFALLSSSSSSDKAQCVVAVVYADAGAVLRADPRRVEAAVDGDVVFARSLLALSRDEHAPTELRSSAEQRLADLQRETSARNLVAWGGGGGDGGDSAESSAYQAWVARFGPPREHARAVAADPAARLGLPLLRALLPPLEAAARAGRRPRVANLMGSNGKAALALALAVGGSCGGKGGCDVLVVDGSAGNARYGRELARAAAEEGEAAAAVEYLVADVLDERALFGDNFSLGGAFDAVFLELGCLHYFVDPLPLFKVCARLLRRRSVRDRRRNKNGAAATPPGRLVVRDFHPFAAKVLEDVSTGGAGGGADTARVAARRAARKGRVLVRRNYFSEQLVPAPVAFSKHQRGGAGAEAEAEASGNTASVLLRQHTLGDLVTAAVRAGLAIEYFEEEAGHRLEDAGVPKLFTLVCRLASEDD